MGAWSESMTPVTFRHRRCELSQATLLWSTTFPLHGDSSVPDDPSQRYLLRLQVAMAIYTPTAFAVASCAVLRSTTARHYRCCRSGTRAVNRLGPISSWNRRSRAPGATVVN